MAKIKKTNPRIVIIEESPKRWSVRVEHGKKDLVPSGRRQGPDSWATKKGAISAANAINRDLKINLPIEYDV